MAVAEAAAPQLPTGPQRVREQRRRSAAANVRKTGQNSHIAVRHCVVRSGRVALLRRRRRCHRREASASPSAAAVFRLMVVLVMMMMAMLVVYAITANSARPR